MPSVFAFSDYKGFLQKVITTFTPQHGVISRLAEAAGCQRSYLSQSLNGTVHLTADHLFGIAQFLHLDEGEREYLLLLLEHDRAASQSYRRHLKLRIEQIKKHQSKIKNKVDARAVDPITKSDLELLSYYSSWIKMAIHTIVSIEKYQTAEAIAARLQLPFGLTMECLNELNKLGFIISKNGRWHYATSNSHISNDSPLATLNHNNWRQKSMIHFPLSKENGSLHYTSVFTMSQTDFLVLKQKILDWIQESRELIGPSPCEEIVCMNIDCFNL